MAKTNFIDANPGQGILGTLVTASFLNKLGLHRHDGLDDDGHCPLDYYVAGGTANALTVTCNPELTQHVPGMPIHIKVAATNTGAVTINFNGLGNVSLTKFGGEALAPGDLVAGQVIKVVNVDQSSYSMLSPVAGGNLQRTIGVSAATTLGPEQTGSLIILSGSSSFTVTLPAPASGRKLVFFNANSQSITLQTPSGIFAGYSLSGVNTFSVPPTTSLTLVSDGANWVVSSYFGSIASAMIADRAITTDKVADGAISNSKIVDGAVSNAKIADGQVWGSTKLSAQSVTWDRMYSAEWPCDSYYQKWPSGAMLQYGSAIGSNNNDQVTFPFAFTTVPFVLVSLVSNEQASPAYVRNGSITTTGFRWGHYGGNNNLPIHWMAFGKV